MAGTFDLHRHHAAFPVNAEMEEEHGSLQNVLGKEQWMCL